MTLPRTVLFLVLLLDAALAPAQNVAGPKSTKPPVLRRGASHAAPASRQAATQLASSFDAGDAYRSSTGQRKLLRLAGALAVTANLDSPEFQRQLTAPGRPLASFAPAGKPQAHGITLLNATSTEQRRQLKQPGALDKLLQSVRATTVGQSANPVFIDPDSGLRLIATRELIVCLKPGTDPRQFFGPDWNRVRPLASDQFVLTLPDATAEDIFSAVNRHAARSEVEWAEPNFILQMAKSYIPNDPLFVDLWHLQNTGQFGGKSNADAALASAWDVSLGNSNIVIAIMDDGVQLDHPDLALNIFSNPGEIPGNGIDDDNNGFVDDVHGWNFFANNNDPSPAADQDNHGTSLAGVIAGVGNNGVGISGAAPGCRLLPLKMLTGEDGVPVTEVSRVLHYAAGLNLQNQPVWRGADVINISLTFAKSAAVDSALTTAATKGRGGKGCAIVCASGNSAGSWVPFEVEFLQSDTYTLRWEFTKDVNDVLDVGADTVWLDNIVFPNGIIESFEEGGLPAGWITGGDAPWINVIDGVNGNHALTGWNGPGSHSLRAGHISDNQSSHLEVTTAIDSGILRFWAWTESEAGDVNGDFVGFDVFHFYVDDTEIDYDFGVPVLETNVAYPANHPSTFAVGASTDFDYRADYSQFGATLDFVAPSDGGNAHITTTDRTGAAGYNAADGSEGDYTFDFGGTSSATPLASGVIALVLSTNPYLTLADLRALLHATTDHIGNVFYDETGFNPFYGYGRLNADRAVKRARPNLIITAAVSPNPVVVGDTTTYTLSVRNNGPNISGPVNITNQLPASTAPGSITPPPLARSGLQIIFHASNLASGALLTYRIVVTNLATGTTINLASVGTDIPESTLADNSVTSSVTVLPLPLLSIGNVTVLETDTGATNAVFTVTLSNPSTHVVSVRYAAVSGAATRGRDFAAASGLLRFAPGETTKTITVRVLPDRLDEDDENFFVNLSAPVNAAISQGQGIGRILDNDPLPALSISDVARAEGNASSAPALFKVRLSAPSGRPVSVQFATAPGSAIAGVDFIATYGILVFAPGKTLLTIPVRIIGDTLPETNETFFLNLSNPIAATLANDQGICTIVNNDTAPRLYISDSTVTEGDAESTNALFNVQLRPASGTIVTVHFSTTNGSAGNLDYIATNGVLTFAPGETNHIISVPVLGDTLSESNETFSVRLSAPANAVLGDAIGLGTILDNDPLPALSIRDSQSVQSSTATTSATFRVELSEISGRTVTVRFATSNGTAVAAADYFPRSGILNFPPGTTTQDVTIVINRATANESTEFFLVNLRAPVNATLSDPQATGTILIQPPAMRTSPRLLELRLVNGSTRLRFQTEAGLNYRVEYREDLSDAAGWKPLPGSKSMPGTGTVLELLDPQASASKRGFYRLRIE